MNAKTLALPLALAMIAPGLAAENQDRLFGKISTRAGRVLEGPIRWDRNEASWLDVLDAYKRTPDKNRKAAERAGFATDDRKEIRILGIRIAELDGEGGMPRSSSLGIRFGHIRSIEPLKEGRTRLILRSGQEVMLEGGSDVGRGVRGIVIEDSKDGKVELAWREIELVEFETPPAGLRSEFGDRLYGTLITRRLGGFTGLICWDVDEIFTSDVLDGDVEGKRRKLPFGDIASIRRRDDDSSIVVLKTGEELILSGTNDVNEDNRGILVMDPNIGAVRVGWDEFERLVLEPDARPAEAVLDGGQPLRGKVFSNEGLLQGRVRWDNDEEHSWEMLDGEDHGVQFEIEFSRIAVIEKSSSNSAVVTLRDGRSFELSGGNDVDGGNKGVFVTLADGREEAVAWKNFRKVEFDWGPLKAEADDER